VDGKVVIKTDFENDYYLQSGGSFFVLEHLDYLEDLTFDSYIKCDHHVNEKVNKSYAVLGLIYRNFRYWILDFCNWIMLC